MCLCFDVEMVKGAATDCISQTKRHFPKQSLTQNRHKHRDRERGREREGGREGEREGVPGNGVSDGCEDPVELPQWRTTVTQLPRDPANMRWSRDYHMIPTCLLIQRLLCDSMNQAQPPHSLMAVPGNDIIGEKEHTLSMERMM